MTAQFQRKQLAASWGWVVQSVAHYAVFLAVLLLATAFVGFRSLRNARLRLPFCLAVVAIAAAVFGNETWYKAYTIAPMACCLAVAVAEFPWRTASVLLVIVGLANQALMTAIRYRHAAQRASFTTTNSAIREVIPPGATVFDASFGFSCYFTLLDRNPMRSAPPTPIPRGFSIDQEVRKCAYVYTDNVPQSIPVSVRGRRRIARIRYSPDIDLLVYGPIEPNER